MYAQTDIESAFNIKSIGVWPKNHVYEYITSSIPTTKPVTDTVYIAPPTKRLAKNNNL